MTNSRLVVDPLHEQTQVGKGFTGHTQPAAVASAHPGVQYDGCSAAALFQMLLQEHCTLHAAAPHGASCCCMGRLRRAARVMAPATCCKAARSQLPLHEQTRVYSRRHSMRYMLQGCTQPAAAACCTQYSTQQGSVRAQQHVLQQSRYTTQRAQSANFDAVFHAAGACRVAECRYSRFCIRRDSQRGPEPPGAPLRP